EYTDTVAEAWTLPMPWISTGTSRDSTGAAVTATAGGSALLVRACSPSPREQAEAKAATHRARATRRRPVIAEPRRHGAAARDGGRRPVAGGTRYGGWRTRDR